MTIPAAGSPISAPSATTTTAPAPSQGASVDYTLGVPFSHAVGGGSIDSTPQLTFTALETGRLRGIVAAAQILAFRESVVTAIGAHGGNAAERANLAEQNRFLQGEIGAKHQLAAD